DEEPAKIYNYEKLHNKYTGYTQDQIERIKNVTKILRYYEKICADPYYGECINLTKMYSELTLDHQKMLKDNMGDFDVKTFTKQLRKFILEYSNAMEYETR